MNNFSPELQLDKSDGLLFITLNRPQKANALTVEMLQGLAEALRQAGADDSVRGVLMTGAGERVFSGGVDVRQASTVAQGELRQARSAAFFALLLQLLDFAKPMVAAVNGVASGGGFMIAALADVIVASDNALFVLPEIDLGTPPLAGLAILTPWVGGALAYDLVQSARSLSATEAEQRGLVRAVVSRPEVVATGEKMVRDLMAKPARAFSASKAWMRNPLREALQSAERGMVAWRAAGDA